MIMAAGAAALLLAIHWNDGTVEEVPLGGPILYRTDTTTIALAWDRPDDTTVVGFVVWLGQEPHGYTHRVDVGNTTMVRFYLDNDDPELVLGLGQWFAAVKSYNWIYSHSLFSDEISFVMGDSMRMEKPPEGWWLETSTDLQTWDDTTKGIHVYPVNETRFFRYREDIAAD